MFNYQKIKVDLENGDNSGILSVEKHDHCYHLKCDKKEAKKKEWYGKDTIDISDIDTVCIPILKNENQSDSNSNYIKNYIESQLGSIVDGHVMLGQTYIPIICIDYYPKLKIGNFLFHDDEWENINSKGNISSFNMKKGDISLNNCHIYYEGIYTREITDGSRTIIRTYVPFSYN